MNSSNNIGGHETNLDFVRAFAVLVVVGAHLSLFSGDLHVGFFEISLLGRLGVVIFFVHSGIVNLLSIERHIGKYGEHRLFRAFMTRRCFRIYPLSIFIVAVIFLSHIPVAHINIWSAGPANHPNAEFLPSLFLVQNFFQFDQLLDPLWSLPYEIQMYCLFPFIYLALRRFHSANILVFAWSVLAAIQFVVAPHLAKHATPGQTFAIPEMLYFFLWFLCGIYAYKEMQISQRIAPFWTLPALIALSCLLCSLSYDRNKFLFLNLCFGLSLPYIQSCQIGFVNRSCAWVAKYSYGIYLLHDPAIWLGFVRFGHLHFVMRASIFLLTTFGGSVVLYHALEHPMILVGNRLAATISERKTTPRLQALAATAGGAA
jgi:peptidoglycan/LPS O-acetylase OafA/YrhL